MAWQIKKKKKWLSILIWIENSRDSQLCWDSLPLHALKADFLLWDVGASPFPNFITGGRVVASRSCSLWDNWKFLVSPSSFYKTTLTNHFVINYGMPALQVQLKGMSSTSISTFPGQFQQDDSSKPISKAVLDSSLKRRRLLSQAHLGGRGWNMGLHQ